jgi:para-nitrobenzyl esterase
MGSPDQGDDSLSVNVWTPAADDGARPVLVWVHGGAFSLGAGSLPVYDGSRLAAEADVVVVTFNYRLGAFGFMVLDDPTCTPNVGLLDQVAALEWVQADIGAFGGDPGNVTVFGESAGGGSVLSLLSMPAAVGLFHSAIVQSGATDLLLEPDRAALVAQAFAGAAGVEPGDLDALRALPGEAVVAAQATAAAALFATVGTMPFHPCVDGEVLPTTWLDAARDGVNPVPLIIGTTRDEMALFAGFDPTTATLDDERLGRRLARLGAIDAGATIDAYRAAGVTDPPAIWSRAQTDTAMWRPALAIAEAHASHAPVFMYRFDRPAANPALGACHGVDIPFAFGTTEVDGWADFLGDPPGAERLSATIRSLWSAFARTGAPTAAGVEWPPFDPAVRATLVLGDDVAVVPDPDAAVRRLWAESISR